MNRPTISYYPISFYIPRRSTSFNQTDIYHIFQYHNLGNVTRVDFVDLENSPKYKSAFVYCDWVYDWLIELLLNDFTSHKFYVNPTEYWVLKRNKNPVAPTELNIHQLAENTRLLEKKITEQNEIITTQKAQIDRIQETIYQILGKVFEADDMMSEDEDTVVEPHTAYEDNAMESQMTDNDDTDEDIN